MVGVYSLLNSENLEEGTMELTTNRYLEFFAFEST